MMRTVLLSVSLLASTSVYAQENHPNQMAFDTVGVTYAHNNGWTGKGTRIAVIDDGIDYRIKDLRGVINVGLSRDFGTQDGQIRNRNHDLHTRHGNPVSSVIAAQKNDWGYIGVAPGTELISLRIDDTIGGVQKQNLINHARAIEYATDLGIQIINRSYSDGRRDPEFLRAVNEYAKTGGIIVNSAGNSRLPNPELNNITTGNRNAWLIVGAVEHLMGEWTIARYSNRAGARQDRFLVAPGSFESNRTISLRQQVNGTSYAAPMVAGAIALLMDKWPHLTGQEAANILLYTARDMGNPEVYGQGMLDIEAAISPVNPLINGRAISGGATNVGTKALQQALSNVTIIDMFGRDFNVSLAGSLVTFHNQRNVRDLFNPTEVIVDNITTTMGYSQNISNYTEDGMIFGYSQNGLGVFIVPNAGGGIKISDFSFLALKSDGLFGINNPGSLNLAKSSMSYVVSFDKTFNLSKWDINTSVSVGLTNPKKDPSSIIKTGNLATSTWSITASRDGFSAGLAQPLTIESGSAMIEDNRASLKTEQRVLQANIGYKKNLNKLTIQAAMSSNLTGYSDTTAFVNIGYVF